MVDPHHPSIKLKFIACAYLKLVKNPFVKNSFAMNLFVMNPFFTNLRDAFENQLLAFVYQSEFSF